MTEQEFAHHYNWYGTFYTLGMEYEPGVGTRQLLTALRTLWQHPLLEGPVLGPYAEQVPTLTPTTIPSVLENMSSLYGVFHLPHGKAVGCLSSVLCPGTEPMEEVAARCACWVLLYIPSAMLERAYSVEYPIESATNPWIDQVDQQLLDVAEFVYQTIPFNLAVLGEEAAAFKDAAGELTAERLAQGGYLVSPRLAARLNPARVPQTLRSGLLWFSWAG